MNLSEIFKLSINSLRNNIMRTALTMLGIVIGISSVIIIIAIGQGASKSITDQVSSFGSNWIEISPVATDSRSMQGPPISTLTIEDAESISDPQKINNIAAATGYITKSMPVSAENKDDKYTIFGGSAELFSIFNIDIDKGNYFDKEDEKSLAKVVVIGPEVAEDLFGEGTDTIGKIVKINSKTFRVIGVTKSKGSTGFLNFDNNIFIPIRTAMKLVFGDAKLQAIFATVKDTSIIETTINDVGNIILDRHNIEDPIDADFSIHNSKDALSILNTVTSLLTLMLAGIAGISLVVGGIGIMNIMLVTVTERTREVGLLKAIGAKKSDILKQFLIEALILTLIGGIIGIILGAILSFWASRLIGIPFVMTPSSILLAAGVSSAIGIIFGFYPANRAAKLNPIDALRFE